MSDESFTEAILRLTKGKGNLSKHAGSWGNLDDAEVERVFREVREAWKKDWGVESS